jgi:hypothetical protein
MYVDCFFKAGVDNACEWQVWALSLCSSKVCMDHWNVDTVRVDGRDGWWAARRAQEAVPGGLGVTGECQTSDVSGFF